MNVHLNVVYIKTTKHINSLEFSDGYLLCYDLAYSISFIETKNCVGKWSIKI